MSGCVFGLLPCCWGGVIGLRAVAAELLLLGGLFPEEGGLVRGGIAEDGGRFQFALLFSLLVPV